MGDNFRPVQDRGMAANLAVVFAEIDRAKANPLPGWYGEFDPVMRITREADQSVTIEKMCERCGALFSRGYRSAAAARAITNLKYCDACTKS